MPDRCTDPSCLEHWPDARLMAALDRLRAEFGDPLTVWGRTGPDAWHSMIGMFTQTGWTPPNA